MNIRLYSDNDIAHCVLSNPPENEMNSEFFRELRIVILKKLPEFNVKGMIIYGQGRHFSSGADIDELFEFYRRPSGPPQDYLKENRETFMAIESLPFPVVAAVNGCCLGAGFELALACRFRIAAKRAVFSLPETGFGIIPGCGGTVRLTGIAGAACAADIILSGRTFSAQEALETGIISAVVEKENLIESAIKLIKDVY